MNIYYVIQMNEIEIRSRIDETKFKELLSKLKSELGEPVNQKQLSFQATNPKDIRVKLIDNSYYLINLKEGTMGDNSRKEISFHIDKKDFKSFIEFLKALGVSKLIKWETQRYKFKIRDISIDLDEISDFGYYIEFEKLCEDKLNTEIVFKELRNLLDSYGLKETTKDDFVNHVNEYSSQNQIEVDNLLQ